MLQHSQHVMIACIANDSIAKTAGFGLPYGLPCGLPYHAVSWIQLTKNLLVLWWSCSWSIWLAYDKCSSNLKQGICILRNGCKEESAPCAAYMMVLISFSLWWCRDVQGKSWSPESSHSEHFYKICQHDSFWCSHRCALYDLMYITCWSSFWYDSCMLYR